MNTLSELVRHLLGLGLDVGHVDALQMVLRTIIIYLFTLAIVRLGSARLLGKASAFDIVVAIMLGSIMSRAINGSAPFAPTLASGVVLLAIHWIFAVLAYRTDWFGTIVKGRRVLLIKDGEIQRDGMRQANLTHDDLAQALRIHTGDTDPSKVHRAYLERNGDISVVAASERPRIVDVSVEHGVQTVRIELD